MMYREILTEKYGSIPSTFTLSEVEKRPIPVYISAKYRPTMITRNGEDYAVVMTKVAFDKLKNPAPKIWETEAEEGAPIVPKNGFLKVLRAVDEQPVGGSIVVRGHRKELFIVCSHETYDELSGRRHTDDMEEAELLSKLMAAISDDEATERENFR